MRTGMGLMFRELCRWELGVRLGWLPMTRRYLDWITWESEADGRVASVRLSWLETAQFPECMYIQDILCGVMGRIA
jgi:hypothetical protein